MSQNLIVVGELHQDLYYESDFYEQLVNAIVKRLINFIRYNPDDLVNRKLLEKLVKKGFSDTPKKIVGHCYFKRGGNGNNSSEYLARLGVPTKLVSVIGRGSEWMYPELQNIGINTDAIFQIDEITPVSTIIKSKFTTKIHLAPNLKNKMNFKGIQIDNKIFENAKLIFSTPIAEKFIELFERGYNLGLITAFNIETQKIQTMEQMSQLIKKKYDIFFLNLKDAKIILNENVSVDDVDKEFKKYAKIRIYTAGKDGSHIITDNFKIFFPGIEVDAVVDRTGAGDCYAAGFLTKIYNLVKDKEELELLLKEENSEKLKSILYNCGQFATYSAIFKITKQTSPNLEDIEKFIKIFNIN
ncbi:MAG: PfkB family carbohydrate kinase [Promethearchaeota archaeon]